MRSKTTLRPPRSAIAPHSGGPKIRTACGNAISTPICAIDIPFAAKYSDRYGAEAPTIAK